MKSCYNKRCFVQSAQKFFRRFYTTSVICQWWCWSFCAGLWSPLKYLIIFSVQHHEVWCLQFLVFRDISDKHWMDCHEIWCRNSAFSVSMRSLQTMMNNIVNVEHAEHQSVSIVNVSMLQHCTTVIVKIICIFVIMKRKQKLGFYHHVSRCQKAHTRTTTFLLLF